MRKYAHSPLEAPRLIRIIKLQPAILGDGLCCQLQTVSLDDPENCIFEAVSYVWGTSGLDRPIVCNGEQLCVTPNCEVALRRFRKKTKTRTLWVDSICIDQTSIQERNQQVKLMKEIYSLAQQVLLWVGESDPKSDEALKHLSRLAFVDRLQFSLKRLPSKYRYQLFRKIAAQLKSTSS